MVACFFRTFLVALAVATAALAQCPQGYTQSGGVCVAANAGGAAPVMTEVSASQTLAVNTSVGYIYTGTSPITQAAPPSVSGSTQQTFIKLCNRSTQIWTLAGTYNAGNNTTVTTPTLAPVATGSAVPCFLITNNGTSAWVLLSDNYQLPTAQTYRTASMVIGADNGSALADADIGPQLNQTQVPYAATVFEIDVNADAGTPSVIVAKRHCSAFTAAVCSTWATTNLLSGALAAAAGGFDACAKGTAVAGIDGGTTCSATLQNTSLAAGDWLEALSGTAGGTAKRLSIAVHFTVN